MKSPKQVVHGTNQFIGEVNGELKKCQWPTRPELVGSTIIVIISCIMLSIYIGVCDQILVQLLRLILNRG